MSSQWFQFNSNRPVPIFWCLPSASLVYSSLQVRHACHNAPELMVQRETPKCTTRWGHDTFVRRSRLTDWVRLTDVSEMFVLRLSLLTCLNDSHLNFPRTNQKSMAALFLVLAFFRPYRKNGTSQALLWEKHVKLLVGTGWPDGSSVILQEPSSGLHGHQE